MQQFLTVQLVLLLTYRSRLPKDFFLATYRHTQSQTVLDFHILFQLSSSISSFSRLDQTLVATVHSLFTTILLQMLTTKRDPPNLLGC